MNYMNLNIRSLLTFFALFLYACNSETEIGTVKISSEFTAKVKKYEKLGMYSDGLALVQRNGKWGYIDIYGDEIIQCQFDGEQYGKKWGHRFSEGLAVVIKDGKYGYIDKNGNVIININYKEAGDFSNGIACVMEYDKDKLSFIDKNGNLIEHLSNKYIRDVVGGLPQFENGVCQVLVEKPKEEQREGDWYRGLWINTKGEEVTRPQSIAVKDELELFWIDDKCGYKDAQGNVIVEAKYSSLGKLSHGVAVATPEFMGKSIQSSDYVCIYGYVDLNGNETFTPSNYNKIAVHNKIDKENLAIEQKRLQTMQKDKQIEPNENYINSERKNNAINSTKANVRFRSSADVHRWISPSKTFYGGGAYFKGTIELRSVDREVFVYFNGIKFSKLYNRGNEYVNNDIKGNYARFFLMDDKKAYPFVIHLGDGPSDKPYVYFETVKTEHFMADLNPLYANDDGWEWYEPDIQNGKAVIIWHVDEEEEPIPIRYTLQ